MNKILIFVLIFISLISCSSSTKKSDVKSENLEDTLNLAEAEASPEGRKVLETSRSMISNLDIVVGGCWDYINGVYNRAGFLSSQRVTVYKSKFRGPYADSQLIMPGDWIYFVNHSYRDIEHSAIFVAWGDEEKKEALMVNYVGGNQKKPGTYKVFVLDNVYNIIRGQVN